MGVLWLAIVSTVIGGLVWLLWQWLRPFNTPSGLKHLPGPLGVPLLGCIPWLNPKAHEIFMKWRQQYGDIFMVPVGIRHVIVIHDIDLIREAYAKDITFAGRPEFLKSVETIVASGGQSRFVFRTGNARWRFLRKTAVKALGLFATSRNSRLNEICTNAAEDLTDQLLSVAGQAVDPHMSIFECTAKVIGTVNFGIGYKKDDPLLEKSVEITEAIAKFVTIGSAMDFLPLTWLVAKKRIKEFLEALAPVNDITEKLIVGHDCSNSEDEIRDLADALYVTAVETSDEQKRDLNITNDHIRFISQDLFGAGFGTTMETLRWGLNLLAVYTEKQAKGQQEIDEIIGTREITLQDLHSLPYVDAILLEIFRISTLIPMSLPHATMQESSLRGYHIPAGCVVFANIYAHHRDPKIFPDPHNFVPERYIKPDGTLDMSLHELVVPFGVGKRRCVGENLARQELFLLLARILQKMCWRPAPGVHIDPEEHGVGITRRPMKKQLVFTKR